MNTPQTIIDDIDYGPLALLAGEWSGAEGMDVAPEPDGDEHNPYYETIVFEPVGDVTNAERQTLSAVRYHQVVRRKSNDKVFHNETGYWLWDPETGIVIQTLTIPRGVSLVAGGSCRHDQPNRRADFEVRAAADDRDWTIAQAPFMRDNARTLEFTHTINVDGDLLRYSETTVVDIYGTRFDHTDNNTLTRD